MYVIVRFHRMVVSQFVFLLEGLIVISCTFISFQFRTQICPDAQFAIFRSIPIWSLSYYRSHIVHIPDNLYLFYAIYISIPKYLYLSQILVLFL